MLNQPSPYHRSAANLRENGFNIMPVWPGKKIPGAWDGEKWGGLPGWAKYCNSQPPEFLHDKWEAWPEAGVCVAHGNIIGLDLDTDRQDVAEALHKAVTPPDVRRRGAKGWLGYYRPGEGLDGLTARVRWYDKDGGVVVEVLLHGTQSVLPPTIHPDTQKPYTWLTDESLESTDISELPVFSGTDMDALDREFTAIGLTRQAPRSSASYDYVSTPSDVHDLEKPWGRSVNDRSMEPAAIDQWWPALGLPKTRQRAGGAWESIASWRGSGSGRALQDRNPNLKITPSGIRDFGDDKPYTPLNLVVHARSCSVQDAGSWLAQFIRPEHRVSIQDMLNTGAETYHQSDDDRKPSEQFNADLPTLESLIAGGAAFPDVIDMSGGVLNEVYTHVRSAMRRDWPEAAFLVALNLSGICIGRNYATWTDLRSNLYTVVLAKSGWGKSSIYGPAIDLLIHAGLKEMIGAERIQSDSALINEISTHHEHKKIYFLDEFGHMLQRCNDKGAGGHQKKIVTEFTNLFSKANGFFAGSSYADGRDKGDMECPHLNIFGMATPGQFWDAFGSGAIEDGTLPRFSILDAVYRPKRKIMDATHIDAIGKSRDVLAPKIAKLASMKKARKGNLGGAPGSLPDVVRVMPSDEAMAAFLEIEDHAETVSIEAEISNPDRDLGGILARVAETAAKIALIYAVTHNPSNPKIEIGDMVAGRRLAWWFASVAIKGSMTHVSDTEHQAVQQKALEFIRTGKGGMRSKRDLTRKMRMKVRDLDDVTRTLMDAELIVQTSSTPINGGTPTIFFTAMKE